MTLDLFAADPYWLTHPRTKLERAFAEFHAANPHVYGLFERYAMEAWKAGARKIGMKAVAERIRWDQRIRVVSEDYKINNSRVSFYARLLLHRHPMFADFIETRERQERDAALTVSVTPVVFDDRPRVLDKAAVFLCYKCVGNGCKRCLRKGLVRCSHPHLLLGKSFTMGDEVETLTYARCNGCGSVVRDPREDAGDVLHDNDDGTVTPAPSFQSSDRD